MAYYKNSNVGQIQTALNGLGNSLAIDNIFGPKTLSAAIKAVGGTGTTVKDLQKALNKGGAGLVEDGVIGAKTTAALLNALNKSGASTSGGATTPKTFEQMSTSEQVKTLEKSVHDLQAKPDALTKLENTKVEVPKELTNLLNNQPGKYETPQEVKDALAKLTNLEAEKPGPYESRYDPQIQGLLDQINNREPFSYDFTKDPMYQQYKDEYTNNARMAMTDTMGEAASLTGGYGSSYASTVGQQAYQNQMRQLSTDIVPELWNMSYQVYKDNEQSLYNQLSAFQAQDAAEYQRYADQLDAYYNDLNYFFNKYQYLDESAYQKYVNDLEQWNKDRNYYYQKYRDDVGDRQNELNYLNSQWRDTLGAAQSELSYYYGKNQDELALAASQAASSGSGSGSGGSGRRSSSKKSSSSSSNSTGNGYTLDPQNVAAQSPTYASDIVASKVDSMSSKGQDWKSYLDSEYSKGRISWDEHEKIRKAYK